jgi:hypothetical protein
MTDNQEHGSHPDSADDGLPVKRLISERKLRANRANAKRSTGPRTEAGKAVSRRNSLKHGIRSRAIDLAPVVTNAEQSLSKMVGLLTPGSVKTNSAMSSIASLWEKMTRVLEVEKDRMQQPGGLDQHGRLLHRYERMLTNQLHARIRELRGLEVRSQKTPGGIYES